jgi:ParB-like chromosome segregation protein Spo0J
MLRIEVLMEIEYRSTDWFRPYAGNPRVNDHAIDRMAASIQEFGFKVPILARSNGEVLDGHLRLKGAFKEGMQEVPVILCDEWSDAQVRAFRLLVNRSATWAHWDLELLAGEIGALQELSFDLSLTGFEPLEIDRLLFAGGVEERGEAVPEPPGYAATRPGTFLPVG